MLLLDRLIRCLQSPNVSTKQDSYVLLVMFLNLSQHLRTDVIMKIMDGALVMDGNRTKGERRSIYTGRILCLGAIIRSRVTTLKTPLLNTILSQIISCGEKRTSLLILATPFICHLLTTISPCQRNKLELNSLKILLQGSHKATTSALYRLGLTLSFLDFGIPTTFTDCVESVVENFIRYVKYEDTDCLHILFQYLVHFKRTKPFWKLFAANLGPYHFDLLHATVLAAIQNGCPVHHILIKDVVTPLVELLRPGVADRKSCGKVASIFRLLLDWDPRNAHPLTEKVRRTAIQMLFDEVNIVNDYRILHSVLRQYLTFLTSEELDFLYKICQPLANLQNRSGNAMFTFLSRLPLLRNISMDTKIHISKDLLHSAFCKLDINQNIPHEIISIRRKIARDGFQVVLKSVWSTEFLHQLLVYTSSVAEGNIEGILLEENLPVKDRHKLKFILELEKNVTNENLASCLSIHGISLFLDPVAANSALDTIIPMCQEKFTAKDVAREMTLLILRVIREESVLFNYEALFSRLAMEGAITADSLQHFVNLIYVDGTEMEVDEIEDSEDEECGLPAFQGYPECSQEHCSDEEQVECCNNSDAESLDMDQVAEADLGKMDDALASVFIAQKRVKNERQLQEKITNRALNLIGILLKRYRMPEDGALPLMLINPCLTLLLRATRMRRKEVQSRVEVVVKKLNGIRKVGNADTFETALIDNVISDIQENLEKKLPKSVRTLISGALVMIQRCFKSPPNNSMEEKRKLEYYQEIDGGNNKRKKPRLR